MATSSPEIQFLAVAEGMVRIRRAPASPQSYQHENLIPGVDGGMNALRPHRRTAGQKGGCKLDHGDGDIREERSVNHLG
jgi:hypothetical protein